MSISRSLVSFFLAYDVDYIARAEDKDHDYGFVSRILEDHRRKHVVLIIKARRSNVPRQSGTLMLGECNGTVTVV